MCHTIFLKALPHLALFHSKSSSVMFFQHFLFYLQQLGLEDGEIWRFFFLFFFYRFECLRNMQYLICIKLCSYQIHQFTPKPSNLSILLFHPIQKFTLACLSHLPHPIPSSEYFLDLPSLSFSFPLTLNLALSISFLASLFSTFQIFYLAHP